jgi:hypothetical protein
MYRIYIKLLSLLAGDDIKKKKEKRDEFFPLKSKLESRLFIYTLMEDKKGKAHGRLLKLYWEKEQDQELF